MSSGRRPRAELARPATVGNADASGAVVVPFRTQRPEPPRTNLPYALTSLIGRDQEIAAIDRALDGNRLVTLVGPGGVGKTRLALQVAGTRQSAYPDGIWLVELAALADEGLVPRAVAAVLGVHESARRPLVETLVDALRTRSMLLVLDNCEHLVDACATLAEALLRSCPRLQILATSREALAIGGEIAWPVPPLATPSGDERWPPSRLGEYPAVRLFVERAAAVLPSFTLTEQNGGTVAQICRRLDGIPLALELAAARVPVLTVEQIAARLDDGIRLLTTGSRTSPRRQRALRATLDWSYDLLTEPEQVLLRRVAVFAGGWTLPAAEAVCDGGVRDEGRGASNLTPSPLIPRGEAATPMTSAQPMFAPRSGPMVGNHPSPLDVLGRLVARSLVQVEHRVSGAAPEARYRLLETVRQYASERLREADEDQLLRQRHSEWCAELAEQAEPRLLGAEQVTWLVRLDDERDNVRAALAWCVEHDPPLGLRIAASLWHFWRVRLYLTEGRRWLESLLTRVSEPTLVRARALVAAGLLANWQLDATAARAYFEEGPELARAHGDRQLAGRALRDLGTLTLSRIGDHRLARELFDEGLLLSRAADDRRSVATNLQQQARLTTAEGDYRRAQTLLDESLNLLTEVGDRWQLATALEDAGGIALTVGQPERAEGLFQESLAMARDLEAAGLGAIHHPHHPGHVAFWRGDAKAAVRWFEEGLAITRANEHTAGIVDNLLGLGRTVHVLGDSARAGALLEEGLRLSAEGSNASGRGVALYGLGLVAWSTGDDALATARLRESLVVRREMDQKLGIAECLEALASVEMSRAASRQAVERALSWLGAADALRERLGAPRPPVSQPAYETAIEAAYPWITDAVAAVEAWRARPLDEVIADALSDKRSDAPPEVATMPRPRRAATGPAAPGPAAPSALAPGGGCPAGLSAREVEVLRLIVDGRTNPQIATALVLSVNTVRHHVTHILDKTGCENRAAVTAFALRHQLA